MPRSVADDPSVQAATPAGAGSTFEGLMKSLEAIVHRLERGELSLEDSLSAYEQGIGLVRAAQARLDGMDQRLAQLLEDGRTVPLQLSNKTRHGVSVATPTPAAADDGDDADDDGADASDDDDDDDDVDEDAG
jgi:exodeoxyribonuclease VII small subunit